MAHPTEGLSISEEVDASGQESEVGKGDFSWSLAKTSFKMWRLICHASKINRSIVF